MRRSGLIHAELSHALGLLRHTDLFAVTDSGLPAPSGVRLIDLGVVYGVPAFFDVLDPVLDEVDVEAAWASVDVVEASPLVHTRLAQVVAPELVAHEELKAMTARCRFIVRTGEATRFANVVLRAGVPW